MNKNFIIGRIKSIKYAFDGLVKLIKTEHSIQVQVTIGIIMVILGFVFGITRVEWMFQLLATGLVLCLEGINSAVEEVADFIHPTYHKKIGLIKDIAAGAVFFAAIIAIVIGILIYYPYIFP
ncbi:diacylglycerol kinase [Mesonia sp. K7]|uniref:diacylglycerol kinase n=1 Tax=Mesonia sp. K7 TaxID=2218606 RepID=UPI000DA97B51|nr:diacylglycerol kinase family protein [Mesonia sp. K7]PZD79368.1 diacylglycerol kinase family protein [Mesonia sp. K7]